MHVDSTPVDSITVRAARARPTGWPSATLAQLDSAAPIFDVVLVAEQDGQIVAAITAGGAALADPFRHTEGDHRVHAQRDRGAHVRHGRAARQSRRRGRRLRRRAARAGTGARRPPRTPGCSAGSARSSRRGSCERRKSHSSPRRCIHGGAWRLRPGEEVERGAHADQHRRLEQRAHARHPLLLLRARRCRPTRRPGRSRVDARGDLAAPPPRSAGGAAATSRPTMSMPGMAALAAPRASWSSASGVWPP